jgi:hypothetical protein
MAKAEAEWQHQYHKAHGIPFRTRQIANFSKNMKLASIAPSVYNFAFNNPITSRIMKGAGGLCPATDCAGSSQNQVS